MMYKSLIAIVLGSAIVACAADAASTNGTSSGDAESSSKNNDPLADFQRDGTTFDSGVPADSDLGILKIMPSAVTSGYDGVHTYKVPVAVYSGGSDLKVVADNPAAAVITPVKLTAPNGDKGAYFMIQTKTATDLKLTATSHGQTAKATISIHTYDPARWTAGQTRYQNGGANGDPACTTCHVQGRAIDHSPAALASTTDTQVGLILSSGVKPDRQQIASGCTDCSATAQKHAWVLTDDEREGLITYLRGLDPRGFQE
jgi:hypothetical protein